MARRSPRDVPNHASGTPSSTASTSMSVRPPCWKPSTSGVAMMSGATVLTRMLLAPHSLAMVRARLVAPALAAPYRGVVGHAVEPAHRRHHRRHHRYAVVDHVPRHGPADEQVLGQVERRVALPRLHVDGHEVGPRRQPDDVLDDAAEPAMGLVDDLLSSGRIRDVAGHGDRLHAGRGDLVGNHTLHARDRDQRPRPRHARRGAARWPCRSPILLRSRGWGGRGVPVHRSWCVHPFVNSALRHTNASRDHSTSGGAHQGRQANRFPFTW